MEHYLTYYDTSSSSGDYSVYMWIITSSDGGYNKSQQTLDEEAYDRAMKVVDG